MLVLVALVSFVSLATLTLLLILRVKTRHLLHFSAKIPGPKPLPIIGYIFELGWKPEDMFEKVCKLTNYFPPVTRIWFGRVMIIGVTEPKQREHLLSSFSVSGRIVHWLKADCSPLATSALYCLIQRIPTPDDVIIQLDLLKMSMVMLETCRGS